MHHLTWCLSQCQLSGNNNLTLFMPYSLAWNSLWGWAWELSCPGGRTGGGNSLWDVHRGWIPGPPDSGCVTSTSHLAPLSSPLLGVAVLRGAGPSLRPRSASVPGEQAPGKRLLQGDCAAEVARGALPAGRTCGAAAPGSAVPRPAGGRLSPRPRPACAPAGRAAEPTALPGEPSPPRLPSNLHLICERFNV